ncbi:MAG: alpha/beta fold hydrolase [Burkholderiaceae bacterium]|nr:alpha/beta fold hydrolase [Burkholderiaceae bacterium]
MSTAYCAVFALTLPCHAADATSAAKAATAAVSATIPAADFFNNPDFSAALLSPSGRYLAAKRIAENGREQLAVVDLINATATSVAGFKDTDIGRVAWISDERLLFDTDDKQIGAGGRRYGPGLYAVNRDGQGFRQLAQHSNPFIRNGDDERMLPWHTFMLNADGAQDSEQVYVANVNINAPGDYDHVTLLKLNTRTSRYTTVDGPGDTRDWLLDAKGEPRIAITYEGDQQVLHYLDPKDGKWRKVSSSNIFKGGQGAFKPLAFGSDGKLYVSSSTSKGTEAVHVMDLESGVIRPQPLVSLEGFDFRGKLIFGHGQLLGVRFLADGEGTQWFDAALQAAQQDIDAKLPRTVNIVTPPTRATTPYLLVEAYSDRQPRTYFIYDREKKTLSLAGKSYPNIKSSQMGTIDLKYYSARDGLRIPAWLTTPTTPSGAASNLPMVVLVHGGPYMRGGAWGWNPERQFLASRGYAVLEPEFRGSAGFGYPHFQAGWKQWGLKMQDDIADGVKWAVAQGIADPKRICIAGASYGGYATLMGLVNDPGLFQCGVNWVGVTDINLMLSGHWRFTSDFSPLWKKYGMPDLIGDPVKDAEQFKATSPLQQAARITQPLLLAYGGADLRVPIIHGTKFRDAVQATNKQVEWVEYAEEGHGWALPKNRIDFWTRVEKFLDKNIGAGKAVATSTPAASPQPAQAPSAP